MIALVDRTRTKVISALTIAAVFATATLSLALAAGKSADSPGRGAGAGSAQMSASAQAGSGSAIIAPSMTTSPASGQSTNVAPDTIGTYVDLGVSHATPIGNTMYLQMDGGVNLNEETNAETAGGVNGRVGLGLKF